MKTNKIVLDAEETELLSEIEAGEWIEKPIDKQELCVYQNHAKYTKSLNEKTNHHSLFRE